MRIATWNVNGLRARLDFLLHWIDARQPDLVGLQELKAEASQLPRAAFQERGYQVLAHTQKAWNGVAVLSRRPAQLLQVGLPGQQEMGARLISARVEGTTFTVVYCPNGKSLAHPDFARKLEWFDTLIRWNEARKDAGSAALLCGDFNICPTELDTWNEEKLGGTIFHTREERQRFRALLEWGYLDLFRELHPEERVFSWWDYRGGAFHRNLGLRIDFLLGTPEVRRRVRSVEIDREYRKKKEGWTASDHAPVMADLEG